MTQHIDTRVHTLALAVSLALAASAASAASRTAPLQPVKLTEERCSGGTCEDGYPLLFRIQSRGERDATAHDSEAERSANVEFDTSGAVSMTAPGVARITGQFRVDLPGGGMAWATEDPQQGRPVMNVRAGSTVPLLDGRFAPSTDDVAALAGPVLRHRMALSFMARADGLSTAGVIDNLCRSLL